MHRKGSNTEPGTRAGSLGGDKAADGLDMIAFGWVVWVVVRW